MSELIRLPPVLRYFGSKWRSAPRYPAPEHGTIVEPFAGGAGYSLSYPDRNVILIESDRTVAGIWKWLVKADPEEVLEIPLLSPGESIAEAPIRKEAKDLVGFWNSISPARPQYKMVPSAARIPSSFWNASIRARLAELLPRIRHWRIVRADCMDFSWRGPATWFVDPVYQGTRDYPTAPAIDYERLAAWCRSKRGQVIVCEKEGADWLPFEPLGSFHAAPRAQYGGAAARRSSEVIWVNHA